MMFRFLMYSYNYKLLTQITKYPGFYENHKIHIRISLDGAQFTRYSTYCLLSFALLGGKSSVKSEGNFI